MRVKMEIVLNVPDNIDERILDGVAIVLEEYLERNLKQEVISSDWRYTK
jgi:hypothetical protein